jgi:four helix bundle protein
VGVRRSSSKFLAIAKGSVGEVETQLYVALDQAYINVDEFASLKGLAGPTKRLIGGLIAYVRTSTMRGAKYK